MIEVALAKKYATALLNTTAETDRSAVLESVLKIIELIINDSKTLNTLTSPLLQKTQKETLLNSILDKASPSASVVNFFKLLQRKNRLGLLSALIPVLTELLNQSSGKLPAVIEIASEVSAETQSKIEALLAKQTAKSVVPTYVLNPDLMGGFKATLGSTVIDASLKNTLENLKESIQNV